MGARQGGLSPEELREAAQKKLAKIILRCRQDPNEFIRWACRVEGGKRVNQGPVHEEWQNFLTEHKFAIIRAPVGMGKTNQLTRWRIVWELGNNPNLRVAIVSAAKGSVPTKLLDSIKSEITTNKWVKFIFPQLRPRNPPHWTNTSIIVQREDNSPDPSVQIFGVNGHILGSRLDLIILDDLHNLENTLTVHACERVSTWVQAEVLSRSPTYKGNNSRVWAIGHRWSKHDTLEVLEKLPGYKAKTYSAFVRDPKTGEEDSLIPEICSIEELRLREKRLGMLAGPMLRNELRDLENARFRADWFDKCLMNGKGLKLARHWNPANSPTFTGFDLAVGQSKKSDLTVGLTFTILPDGTRRLLDIRKGRWTAPEILRQVIDVHNCYGSIIGVENNSAQDFLIQFAHELASVPLKRHNTGGSNKWGAFGVESLAIEFENGLWSIPCNNECEPDPVVADWIKDFLSYSHDRTKHTSDMIMATWICREVARESGYSADGWAADEDLRDYLDINTLVR